MTRKNNTSVPHSMSSCPRDYSDLMCAILDWEDIESLLAKGEDPNYETNSGMTPLMLACQERNTEHGVKTILTLLKYGADPNKANRYGERALVDAIQRPSYVYVKTLLDHGADIYFSFVRYGDEEVFGVQTPQILIESPKIDTDIHSRSSMKELRKIKSLIKRKTKSRSNILCEIRKEPIPKKLWKEVQVVGRDGLVGDTGTQIVWADTGKPVDDSDIIYHLTRMTPATKDTCMAQYDTVEHMLLNATEYSNAMEYSTYVDKNKRQLKLFEQQLKRKPGEDIYSHIERLKVLF